VRKRWFVRVLEVRRTAEQIARAELAGALSAQARSRSAALWVSPDRAEVIERDDSGAGTLRPALGRAIVAADAALLEESRRAAEVRVAAGRLRVWEARRARAGFELLERRRREALARRAVRGEAAELDERNRMLGSWPP